MNKSGSIRRFFGVPFMLWAVLFILLPLFFVLQHGLTNEAGVFSLANVRLALEWEYLKALGLSILLALISTVCCLVLGYPLCLILREYAKKSGVLIFLLFLLPLGMNSLLTTMAW